MCVGDSGGATPFPLDVAPIGVSLGSLPFCDTWKVRLNATVSAIPAGTPVQIQNCADIKYDSSKVTTCVTEDVEVPAVPAITV